MLRLEVTAKGIMEVGELVALQRPISQADRVRDDLEPRQEASHAVRGDRLASFPFRPRAALDGDQHLDQFGRWQPVRPALREDGADIGKQSDAGGLIIVTGGRGNALNSPASAPRPFAADGIGDGEQRAPVISGAVKYAVRNVRVRTANVIRVVLCPPRRLPRELVEMVGAVEIGTP